MKPSKAAQNGGLPASAGGAIASYLPQEKEPMQQTELTLHPATDEDIGLLEQWLRQNYILKWYEDAESWLAEFRGRGGEFCWLHHCIARLGGQPIGFCQYYDCWDARALEDWYRVDAPGQLYSIDYLIGEPAFLGQGWGKQLVRLLSERVRRETGAKQIIVQPDKANFASCGVLRANGYRYQEALRYYSKTW